MKYFARAGNVEREYRFERRGERGLVVQLLGRRIEVQVEDERERTAHAVAGAKPAGPRAVCAVMPGIVVEVAVREGDVVADGQTLLVLEAMKMRNPIAADGAGRVKRVLTKAGQAVAGGALLVELEAAS
jgi:biotin carboxyl carrier protein